MRVGILGLGLIGGSLLRRLSPEEGLEVSGWDAAPEVRTAADRAGFAVAASEGELCGRADLVLVATPPRVTAPAVLRALAASERVVVSDVASVKAPVLGAVRAGADREVLGRYVPGHPLAGAEAAGWGASRAALLDDAVWAICPSADDAPLEPLLAVAGVLDRLGARLAFCTAEDHDAAVARSSHAPHVVAQALALAADTPLSAVLSGGALRDGTRVAGANPELWGEVLALNRDAVLAAVRDIERRLAEVAALVESADDLRLAAIWRAAGVSRRLAERARWEDPSWSPFAAPALEWTLLLRLGEDGHLVRRLEDAHPGFRCQVARAG